MTARRTLLLDTLENAARQVGVKPLPAGVRSSDDLEAAFAEIARGGATAALHVAHSLFFRHRQRLANLAIRHRMAFIGNSTEQADAGMLLSYGADLKENVKRLAPWVDRILRGADPATIPVEQANVYELVINLRTARTLGVELPRTLLLRATRVIQ
jgi:putative tryptophan/tyrosine transport system substrate-binding protein